MCCNSDINSIFFKTISLWTAYDDLDLGFLGYNRERRERKERKRLVI